MTRFWCSRSSWGGPRGGILAAILLVPLAGCGIFGGGGSDQPTTTPEPVAGPAANTQPQPSAPAPNTMPAAPPPEGTQPAAQPAQGQTTQGQTTYPNLGTVPQQAPTTTSAADRQQIASGLVADNQNAAYSQQQVTAQQETTPAPAPIPAPVPAQSASGTSTAAGSSGTSTVAVTPPPPEPQPAPQPTSQTTVGQTVTNQETASASPATSSAPAMTVVEQPVAPPATTGGATPMAPPPNPIPPTPTPEPTTVANASPSGVTVDTSQLGGSPLPGYQPVPVYSTGPLPTSPDYAYGPSYAPAPYGLPVGAAPVAGQPVAIIFFADASSAISERAQWVLHNVYLLQQQVGGRLRLVGNASLHTVTMDPQRHDQVNYRISQSRANAVARALIGMGVPQGALAVAAQGSQAPLFYEFMPTGEAANRRVEIYLDR